MTDRQERYARFTTQGRAARTAAAEERYARYIELRRTWTVREVAWDLGVCFRQAWRYEARRRAELEVVAMPAPCMDVPVEELFGELVATLASLYASDPDP